MSLGRAALVTSRMPWPLDDGGRVGLWQSVWSLAQAWRTTLFALVTRAELDQPVPDVFAALGVDVVRIAHQPPRGPWPLVRGLVGPWPYTLERWRSPGLESALRRFAAREAPDLVVFGNLHVSPAARAVEDVTRVLRQANLESLWMERFGRAAHSPLVRAYAAHQAARLRRAEARVANEMDLVLALHEDEARALRALAPHARIETLPFAFDFARFPAMPGVGREPVVLLAGTLGWEPNRRGILRFLDQGAPALRAAAPGVRLRVVGKDPTPDIEAAARRAGAEFAANVPSMAEEYARAAVLVVPLWFGAGIRVKIVEAMAASLPVASTPLGAEGLGLVPGEHLAIADDPAALAREAARLIADPAGASAMAARAREFARSKWSLAAVAEVMNARCAEAVEARARSDTAGVGA